MKPLLYVALAVRLVSVFVVQTSYVPDETWQCTEVAHKLVFGTGHLTWEWKEGLRSYLHPLLFAIPLKLVKVLNIDTAWMVVLIPRLFQAAISFLNDVLLYRLVVKLYGHPQATYVLIMQISSWYLFYVSPRPLVNNLEMFLITATLNLWPTRYNDVVTYPAVSAAAISVAIRPTTVLVWLVLGIHYLLTCPERYSLSSVTKACVVGVPTLICTTFLDTFMYSKPTLVFYNFLNFNMFNSAVYGSHPWHWYLSQGLPGLLGTHMIFIVIAFVQRRNYLRQFMAVVISSVALFSAISHKEFRFLQHLMPIFMIWAGLGLHWLSRHMNKSTLYMIIIGHTLVNAIVAFYISFFHQRGTISVIHDLSARATDGDNIVFLMPCHSTPFHSHMHQDGVGMRFLDCSPGYDQHEESLFYDAPLKWWSNYRKTTQVKGSEYVVIFEEALYEMHTKLKETGYAMIKRYFHAHVLVDDRLGQHLLLYKKSF